jgi:protein-S-isoprenylcysteine O-methyltransferase Ste14
VAERDLDVDTARYVVALITIVSVPPAILFWLVVHPNVRLWRRLGPWLSYTVLVVLMVGVAVGVYMLRDPILSVEYGTNGAFVALAAPIYGAAIWLSLRIRRHLSFRIFVGVPELSARGNGGKLLTQGVYGQVRHPRYVAVLLGLISSGLFSNYLAPYIMILLGAAGLWLIVRLEEKELVERFGNEYKTYRERVPMFVPRRGRMTDPEPQ